MRGYINKAAFEEYQENEKKKTICILKFLIIFLIITNICFLIFFISFKIEIIKTKSSNYSISFETSVLKDSNDQQENQIQKMFVNIFATIDKTSNSLTEIIQTKKEYEQIMSYSSNQTKSFICYQGSHEGDHNYKAYHYFCGYFREQIILIELDDFERFGVYLSQIPDDLGKKDFYIDDPNAIMFNLDNGKIYKVKDPKNVITLYKDGFFKIGNNDLYIANNYMTNSESYSDFPKQFGEDDVEKNEITNGKRNLTIVKMEVFSLWRE